MTPLDNDSQNLKSRPIRRKQVYLGLAMAAVVAGGVAIYNGDDEPDETANDPIDAVFYQTTAQCEADIKQQQTEYAALQQKYQTGQLTQPPQLPTMQAEDCAAQMQAAQQEHERTAPIYNSIDDCQAEGVKCESVGGTSTGYRPSYGGTYIDPYSSGYTYIYSGGGSHRVYDNRPVYQSATSGFVVTPYGREIPQTAPGRVSVPRHTQFAAPARPSGTSAKGTIKGRSSQGFGSSFKSTGRGGK